MREWGQSGPGAVRGTWWEYTLKAALGHRSFLCLTYISGSNTNLNWWLSFQINKKMQHMESIDPRRDVNGNWMRWEIHCWYLLGVFIPQQPYDHFSLTLCIFVGLFLGMWSILIVMSRIWWHSSIKGGFCTVAVNPLILDRSCCCRTKRSMLKISALHLATSITKSAPRLVIVKRFFFKICLKGHRL